MFNPIRSSDDDFLRRSNFSRKTQDEEKSNSAIDAYEGHENDSRSIAIIGAGKSQAVIPQVLSDLLEIDSRRPRVKPLNVHILGKPTSPETRYRLSRHAAVIEHGASNPVLSTWQEEGKTHFGLGDGKEVVVDNFLIDESSTSNGKLIGSALENGILRSADIELGGDQTASLHKIARDSLTCRVDSLGSGYLALGRNEAQVAIAAMMAEEAHAGENDLTPPKLQRDELIGLCNRHLRALNILLKSEQLRTKGEINEETRRLLLPNRRAGESIFSLDNVEQFAVYIGMVRPESAKDVGQRDDHIVSTLTPGGEATPLCYYSAKQADKNGSEFWLNIVLWNQKKMEQTKVASAEQKHWTPPARAGHPETVRFALYGDPERGELPAFSEVHFMLGTIDKSNIQLVVEEYRLSRTPTAVRDGERVIYRYMNPKAYDPFDKRWVTVANERLRRNRALKQA
ncbi:hypothetical protein LJR230_002985 [Trinickia sp. LjRoot230]|uniref:hypothetical protein n=1 Tax=Trinickia sp. LjRoot230 TaxID=3342288 RepID=UPI003ED0FA4E